MGFIRRNIELFQSPSNRVKCSDWSQGSAGSFRGVFQSPSNRVKCSDQETKTLIRVGFGFQSPSNRVKCSDELMTPQEQFEFAKFQSPSNRVKCSDRMCWSSPLSRPKVSIP